MTKRRRPPCWQTAILLTQTRRSLTIAEDVSVFQKTILGSGTLERERHSPIAQNTARKMLYTRPMVVTPPSVSRRVLVRPPFSVRVSAKQNVARLPVEGLYSTSDRLGDLDQRFSGTPVRDTRSMVYQHAGRCSESCRETQGHERREHKSWS